MTWIQRKAMHFSIQKNKRHRPSFYNIFTTSTKGGPSHSATNGTKVLATHANSNTNYSKLRAKFIGSEQVTNPSHWEKAFERTMGDFVPLLTMPSEVKIGLLDGGEPP
jgi:hypothetical protein